VRVAPPVFFVRRVAAFFFKGHEKCYNDDFVILLWSGGWRHVVEEIDSE